MVQARGSIVQRVRIVDEVHVALFDFSPAHLSSMRDERGELSSAAKVEQRALQHEHDDDRGDGDTDDGSC